MSFQSQFFRRVARAASKSPIRQKATNAATTTKSEGVPVGLALAAAGAGIATVAGVSAAVEYGSASSVPTFDPNGQRFSQENFSGRFCKMLLACDPRLLLYSEEEVRQLPSNAQRFSELSWTRPCFVGSQANQ